MGLAFALSGSRSGAEDIAQDAFLAAHRDWSRIVQLEQPSAWVRRVAANIAVSAFRKRVWEARALVRLSRQRPPLPPLNDDATEFWSAVRALPKRQAQAVALRYFDDLPNAEIAVILGCSESTVRVHLHNGRKALAARLNLREDEMVEQ